MADVDEICLFSHTEGLSYDSARVTDRIFPDREHHIAVERGYFHRRLSRPMDPCMK